ncbi:MAG: 1-deoxy-D-xylulose-5-phosphate reductoisomerase [Verrucomicrobiales bacterium]|jgi:1-deoxy-D-xylulose-5-phosphate reductoisomerase|nr:1-deoxy-D-xylulose-5-phosphate reductoisomerase [Verrucomicrobiales bacterium]
MKRVILLGSSGSIGRSACKVARELPERMKIVGLAVSRSVPVMLAQAREFGVKSLAVFDEQAAADAGRELPADSRLCKGAAGLVELVRETEADLVLVAIVGTAGLAPALAALSAGKDLAVASKEILVMAGEAVMKTAADRQRKILPVDSEHNAIFQCLQNAADREVRRLILTASGGPFRQTPKEQLATVSVEQALKHPTWNMGTKITIDSATLFNKGLEMIEARWLFNVEMARIDVIIHPQSIVHSMVEFVDHSVLAQLSHSDMCFPIQYAVTYPDRLPNNLGSLDFAKLGQLIFEAPDLQRFPALTLARHAGTVGGTMPAVFNAANEVAVARFLERRGTFPQIWESVEKVMAQHNSVPSADLDTILAADAWARRACEELHW